MEPITITIAAIAALRGSKVFEKAYSEEDETTLKAITSLREITKKELEEDTINRSVLNQLPVSNDEEPSNQTLEVIAETLEEKIETDPDFASAGWQK
ncbi:MAG: hypothetical protein QNJ74_07460 [Trichodesmium sp. MO_231.B1]|nr:hypothetical protein [Trichodesmium sp. MO_231.B1]